MRKIGKMLVIGAEDADAREMTTKDVYQGLLRFLVYPSIILYRMTKYKKDEFPLIPYRLIYIKKALNWIIEYEKVTMGKVTNLFDLKKIAGDF